MTTPPSPASSDPLPVGVDHVLDALKRAIVATDLEGRVIAWNRAAERMFGWTHDDALGRNLLDLLVDPVDRRTGTRAFRQALAGRRWEGDFTVRRRDGSTGVIATTVTPLRDADGAILGVVGSAEDVTRLRQLRRTADDLARRLQLALAAGHLGTWQSDHRNGTLAWDETTERLFGLEPGSFDGTADSWLELVHPDDREAVQAVVDRAIATKSSFELDHRVIHPDGSVRWLYGRGTVTVDEQGEVVGTAGCVADITARKLHELESERRAAELTRVATLERRERERLEFLGTLSQAAIDARDHRAFIDAVAEAAVPRLGDWCVVHFLPDGSATPEVFIAHADPRRAAWARQLAERTSYDPDAPRGPAAVIRTGEVEFVPDVAAELGDQAAGPLADRTRELFDELELTSSITVPLRTKRAVIGAMTFVSAESGRRYDASDLALTEAAAGRVAEALENMWLTDQQLNIAVTLQEALLPPALPSIPGVEVAARYWAAGVSAVGGDFYDVFRADVDQWAVVIGDVCGTGASAAAVTSIARHTIRAAAKHGNDHDGVMAWLDDALKHANRGSLFVSVCFGTLDRDDGRWTFRSTSGGHPLPVLVRANGDVEPIGKPGTILGILDEIRCHTAETTLAAGDTLVLYTDGMTDVRPPHGLTADEVHRIAQVAAQASTAEGVAERVRQQIADRLPMAQRTDDIALVVLRITD